MQKLRLQKRYELRTNWKLVAENFRECYHCGPAHPEYCNAVIGANLRESATKYLPNAEWNGKKKDSLSIMSILKMIHFILPFGIRFVPVF